MWRIVARPSKAANTRSVTLVMHTDNRWHTQLIHNSDCAVSRVNVIAFWSSRPLLVVSKTIVILKFWVFAHPL